MPRLYSMLDMSAHSRSPDSSEAGMIPMLHFIGKETDTQRNDSIYPDKKATIAK